MLTSSFSSARAGRFRFGAICLIIAMFHGIKAPTAAEAGLAGATIEDLIAGIRARNLSFGNASARITYRDRRRTGRGLPLQARIQVMNTIFNNKEDIYLDLLESREEDRPDSPKRQITMTVNQAGTRELMPVRMKSGERLVARIKRIKAAMWAIEPARLLFLMSWSPEEYLRKVQHKSLGEVQYIDGLETVGINWEWDASEPGDADRRGIFWIAPSRGHAIVKCEESIRHGRDGQWKLFVRTELKDFQKIGEMWLPAKAEYSEHRNYSDGTTELFQDVRATFERWSINQNINKNTFELVFPDKAAVTDEINKTSYIKGDVSDAKIAEQVARAKGIASQEAARRLGSQDLESKLDETLKDCPFDSASSTWGVATVVPSLFGLLLVSGLLWLRYAKRN